MYQIQIKKFNDKTKRFEWKTEKTNGKPDKFKSVREAVFIVETMYSHISQEYIQIIPTRYNGHV